MHRFVCVAALLGLSLLLNACTTVVNATTSEPIEPNPGKRTLGTKLDDGRLERIATVNLNKVDDRLAEAPISVHSHNEVVLLVGQVPNQELRELAGQTVNQLPRVRQVHNELEVEAPISFLARVNDNWLGTKIKTKLLANRDIEGSRVKVIVENNTVYLMGLVSRTEGEEITNVARHTRGVQKVVRVFEYID